MNIAAVIEDLAISQKSFYLIKAFNKGIDNTDNSFGVFYQRPSIPPIEPLFGCKLTAYLASFEGVVIPTTLKEAEICLKSTNKTRIFLYLWDLSWLENSINFSKAMDILRNEKTNIIARSASHAKCIENFCNKTPIGIVDNWDMDDMMGIINES